MKRGGLDCVAGQNTQGVKQNKSQKQFKQRVNHKIHSFSIDKFQVKE